MGPNGEETQQEKLNRNFAEILQEVRVAQTGVQILFAFLLTLAFTPAFAETTAFQRGVYITTLMLATAATGLLVGPVAYHRITSGRKMRPYLVVTANRQALGGITFLMLALTGSILLVTNVVLGHWPSVLLTVSSVVWLIVIWYVIPLAHLKERAGSITASPDGVTRLPEDVAREGVTPTSSS